MIKNTENGYGIITILIHWLFAFSIIGMFGLGYWMIDLDYYSEYYKSAPNFHKSVGMILFFLLFFRIFWKAINISPKGIGKNYEIALAKIGHYTMYLLMVIIFASGYFISTSDGRGIEIFNIFTIPSMGEFINNQESIMGKIHFYSTYTLIGFVFIHALAACRHHFYNKDETLKRIIKPIK